MQALPTPKLPRGDLQSIVPGRSIHYRESLLITLERLALIGALLAVMLPLKIERGPLGIALFQIPLAVLCMMWFLRVITRRRHAEAIVAWDLGVVLLILALYVSTLLRAPGGLPKLFVWSAGLLLALYARANWGGIVRWRTLFGVALAILAIQLAFGVVQLVGGSEVGNVQAYYGEQDLMAEHHIARTILRRAVGTVGLPNLYGNLLTLLLPFAFQPVALISRRRGWLTRPTLAALVALALALMAIGVTRTNFVVALFALFLLWGLIRETDVRPSERTMWIVRRVLLYAVSLAVVLGLLWLLLRAVEQYHYGYARLALNRIAGTEDHLGVRLEQYRGAILSVLQHPILGVGFANSGTIWSSVGVNLPLDTGYMPHNIYLIVATEGGLPSLGLFLIVLLSPFRLYLARGSARSAELDAMAVCVLSFLLVGMTYVVPFHHGIWPLFCFYLGAFRGAVSPRAPGGSG